MKNGYRYTLCRLTRHPWRFHGFKREQGEIVAVFQCRECPTWRQDGLSARGELLWRFYDYPDYYKLKERPTVEELRRSLMKEWKGVRP